MTKLTTRRTIVGAAVIALTAWIGMVPAGAQTVPAPTVNPSSVVRGDSFSVSGTGCSAGADVRVPDLGLRNSSIAPDNAGNWTVEFQVPADAALGAHAVVSFCVDQFTYPGASVTVIAEATTTTTTAAPTTTAEATTTLAPTSTAPAAVKAAVAATPALTG